MNTNQLITDSFLRRQQLNCGTISFHHSLLLSFIQISVQQENSNQQSMQWAERTPDRGGNKGGQGGIEHPTFQCGEQSTLTFGIHVHVGIHYLTNSHVVSAPTKMWVIVEILIPTATYCCTHSGFSHRVLKDITQCGTHYMYNIIVHGHSSTIKTVYTYEIIASGHVRGAPVDSDTTSSGRGWVGNKHMGHSPGAC